MNKYKGIPITAAKEVAYKYAKSQVIIVTWDAMHGKTHVTTYGRSIKECEQAAAGGNLIKKALGWPDEMCRAKPRRIGSKHARSSKQPQGKTQSPDSLHKS